MKPSRASVIAASWMSRLFALSASRPAPKAEAEDPGYGEPVVVEEDGVTVVRLDGDVVPHLYASWFYPGEAVSDVGFLKALDRIPKGSPIRVAINSLGGDVFGGTAIANAVASRGAETVVTGIAASIASVIMAAGKRAHVMRGATVMVHKPWSLAMGNATALRAEADVLDKVEEAMLDIYVGKSGKKYTRDQWRAALAGPDGADGTWWTGSEAVAAGIADSYEQPVEEEPTPRKAALLLQRKTAAQLYCSKLPKNLDDMPAGVAPESPKAPATGGPEAKRGASTTARRPGVSYL